MITEERLKELIEQKAVIYAMKDNKYIYTIGLNQELDVVNWFGSGEYKLCVVEENGAVVCDIANIEQLFETREEAEWQSEFSNITRTETLKLPTWEEFCKAPNLKFCGAEHNLYHLFSDLKWLWLEQVVDEDWTIGLYLERATKENYIEACRLAKKLFLGEEI